MTPTNANPPDVGAMSDLDLVAEYGIRERRFGRSGAYESEVRAVDCREELLRRLLLAAARQPGVTLEPDEIALIGKVMRREAETWIGSYGLEYAELAKKMGDEPWTITPGEDTDGQ